MIKDQKETVYDSGRLPSARLNVRVNQPGAYAVCFGNTFSLVSSKTVRANIKLVTDTRVENLTLGFAAGLGALSALGDVVDGKPIDQAVVRGLNSADGIFNDMNWARRRGYQRALRDWRVVTPTGMEQRANLEIVFVSDYHETDTWCRRVLQALYKEHPTRLGAARDQARHGALSLSILAPDPKPSRMRSGTPKAIGATCY